MINGNVAEITAEIVDLVTDTLVEFFKAKRDAEFDLINEAVGIALNCVKIPVKQCDVRFGRLSHAKIAREMCDALVGAGIVRSSARQKDLKAALEKAFWVYSGTFKTKKVLKEIK